MTQPAGSPPTGDHDAADADADASPADHDLFARKGDAAPAPVAAKRPHMCLVDDAAEPPAESAGAEDDSTPTPPPDMAGESTLFPADEFEPDRPVTPPAASLDENAFDPARRRPLVFDDAPVVPPEAPEAALPAAGQRPGLPTLVLIGAAAVAAIAALVTAASWYASSDRNAPGSAPVVAEDAPADPSAPAAAADMLLPPPPATPVIVPPPRQQPVIDLVRVEPGGATIIAGRAKPGTALVVLDNDTPLGSVIAGETGDWMLTPERSLTGGDHEIALAVKHGDGAVSVATPASADTRAQPLPRPASPDGTARYVAQIASVKTEQGAQSEWARMKAALPALLGRYEPTIDSAEVRDRGTFYRIRLGPFTDRAEARTLCNSLVAAGRDCLVVRR